MRWSKLRSLVEAQFSEDLGGRVTVHVTRHLHSSRSSHGWIAVDGKSVADFCDWAHYRAPSDPPKTTHGLVGWGEFEAQDFKRACWAIVHNGIESSLTSDDPLQLALAVLHHKFGKRRVRAMLESNTNLSPLVRFFCEFRISSGQSPNYAIKVTAE
jgi:hypothetical protein